MNERIRELMGNTLDEKFAGTWSTMDMQDLTKFSEKFAELIVKECARIARATPCPYEEYEVRQRLGHTWDIASIEAGREIVKHFGVEK